MPNDDEIFFFYEKHLKSQSEISTEQRESLDQLTKKSPATSKKQLSPCENKERSLDCPSTRLAVKKWNTVKNHENVVKIQVENCGKEKSKSLSVESSEDVLAKEKTDDQNSLDSLVDGDCGTSNKSVTVPSRNKKCTATQQQQDSYTSTKKPASESKNKFTWCGSCKSSKTSSSMVGHGSKTATAAAASVAAKSKRTASTSPLKKLSRSSLSTDTPDNSKITLNLSKYSPCASRLAASSKILSSDSVGVSSGISPESPLHVSKSPRAKSPVQVSLSLNIQQVRRSTINSSVNNQRSKSCSGPDSCVTSPTSDATNLSCSPSGTEILSLEDVSSGNNKQQNLEDQHSRAVTTAASIELSLDRERWSSNYRSPR